MDASSITDDDYNPAISVESLKLPDAFPPEYITLKLGKPFILFTGLTWLLHHNSQGRFSVDTDIVQLPSDADDTAIVKATVSIFNENGMKVASSSGIGDANKRNVSSGVAQHVLRMAETRAVARALRILVNAGLTALEELGSNPKVQDQGGGFNNRRSQQRPPQQGPQRPVVNAQQRPPQQGQQAPQRALQQGPQRPPQQAKVGGDQKALPQDSYADPKTGRVFSRQEVLARYHGWEQKLVDLGYKAPEMLPDFAPISEIVEHMKELRAEADRAQAEAERGGGGEAAPA